MAARLAEPRNANAHADCKRAGIAADRIDAADDLVAGHDGELRIRQFAVDDMKVGAADPASGDPHPDLPAGRLGIGPLHR